jgi:hypothetical protein
MHCNEQAASETATSLFNAQWNCAIRNEATQKAIKRAISTGWRTSGDRTYLRADSLLTGNFTGKLAISSILGIVALTNRPCRIDFSRNSLATYQGKHFGDQGIFWRKQDKTPWLNHAGAGLVPRHERSP